MPEFGPSPGFRNLRWFKPVYAGDEVATGPDGAVGIVFIDDTTFSLSENGRITLSGTASALILATPALAAVGDALAPLRAATTY